MLAKILLACMIGSFGFAIALGWATRTFVPSAALPVFLGMILFPTIFIAYRRIMLPSLFGKERHNILTEMTNVFVAQAATRSERAVALESLKNEIRDDRSRRK
jgi:hypothetical protein